MKDNARKNGLPSMAWRIGKTGLIVVGVFAVIIFMALIVISNAGSLNTVSSSLDEYRWVLFFVRIMFMVGAWLYWENIVEIIFTGAKGDVESAKRYLHTRRNYYIGVLLLIEILLVQNVAGYIIGMVQ